VHRLKILRGVGCDSGRAATALSKPTAPTGETNFVLDNMEATNAKLEVILDRMNTMTDEMQNFCKQMEDYGSDLNDIKRKLVDKDHPAPGP
jgi:hypothetical protein